MLTGDLSKYLHKGKSEQIQHQNEGKRGRR